MIIGIFAPKGRMGLALRQSCEKQNLEYKGYDKNDLEAFCRLSDVIIDFSSSQGTHSLVTFLNTAQKIDQKPLVVGTTGLSDVEKKLLHTYSRTSPVFYAQNFSIGVQVQKHLCALAARLLDYDIEVMEIHHKHKKDEPSGTALVLGNAMMEARNALPSMHPSSLVHHRTGPRKDGEIGLSALRGGNTIGEHHVLFLGSHDTLEIVHKGHDRSLYADGALKAARFIKLKNNGMYGMDDLFPPL